MAGLIKTSGGLGLPNNFPWCRVVCALRDLILEFETGGDLQSGLQRASHQSRLRNCFSRGQKCCCVGCFRRMG